MGRHLLFVSAIALVYWAVARATSERYRRVLAIVGAPVAWSALAVAIALSASPSPELAGVLAAVALVVTSPTAVAVASVLVSPGYLRPSTVIVLNVLAWLAAWFALAAHA